MREVRFRYLLVFSFTVLLISSACKTTQEASSGSSEGVYQQEVDPFPVYDQDGNKIDFPFMGGFNTPRPQFVDIDNDGDPDLFVQEQSEDLMFFENVAPGTNAPLEWKTNKYKDLDIGEWFRFVDMDQDGDLDLLSEQPYSYIRYYRNEGSAEAPEFVLAVDSLRDVGGAPIFSDRQNIPNVTDIDCDDKLDLFIGSLDGTLARYESQGRDENGIPQFELVTKRFQNIEIVKQFGTMHGANTMAFMDIDSDGDQDIFWGDFFEPSILLLENIGSCSNPQFLGEPRSFPPSNPVMTSGYNVPSLVDWELDGDMDLFLGVLGGAYNTNETTAQNFYFFEQDQNDFTLKTTQFLSMIDAGDESIIATGDIDGNGLPDLLVANKIDPEDRMSSRVYWYLNTGTRAAPEFKLNGFLRLPNGYHYAPALADLDNDGLDDLLLGNWKGDIAHYRNTGEGFELVNPKIAELERGSNAVPTLADIDGDGDLDLISGQSGGGVALYRNDGKEGEPIFMLDEEAFQGIEVNHRSAPAFNDIDGDGDLDLFLGSKIDGFTFYKNDGTATEPSFVAAVFPFEVRFTRLGAPHFADLDGDGIAEFLSGNRGGGILFYRK
jgi:hypothetical protein